MAAGDLILLTGGTGFIGFRTLRYALEQGYTVRAAVRSDAKAEQLRNNPTLTKVVDRLQFVVVPDILADGAYDEAVKGVKYIVHLASPLIGGQTAEDDLDAVLVAPAVKGTIAILEAAKKEPGVKRVVITSSVVAIVPFPVFAGMQAGDRTYGPSDRGSDVPKPYPAPIVAYVQSKIEALREGEAWLKANSPVFDVITIHPGFVGGRNDLARNADELLQGTNSLFIAPVLGQDASKRGGASAANAVDVDDVAKAHIESLRDDVPGNQAFILDNVGGDFAWNDAKKVVEKHFPEALKSGILSNDGSSNPHFFGKLDIELTEKTFGKLKTHEETIVALVGQYLELKEKGAQ
jgi:nucleoside-diphosphate-sugar epimerase